MLLWSPRSRAVVLTVFALVVTVVFVLPLGTVVLAGLAGSWTGPLPSNLGLARFGTALSGEDLASLSVSLQTAFLAGGIALIVGPEQHIGAGWQVQRQSAHILVGRDPENAAGDCQQHNDRKDPFLHACTPSFIVVGITYGSCVQDGGLRRLHKPA